MESCQDLEAKLIPRPLNPMPGIKTPRGLFWLVYVLT